MAIVKPGYRSANRFTVWSWIAAKHSFVLLTIDDKWLLKFVIKFFEFAHYRAKQSQKIQHQWGSNP